jgi:heptaprenyl diphosphate synthase
MEDKNVVTLRMIKDANILFDWVTSYICKPHPLLGRKGDICPFAQPSIDKEKMGMVFHYEVDGRDINDVVSVMRHYMSTFPSNYPKNASSAILQTLLVVFPAIPAECSTVIDDAHKILKDEYVQNGLMLGQFHMTCPEPAVYNPDFSVMVSPLPFYAIRYMAQHDILFLHSDPAWFSEYDTRLGEPYRHGKVSNPLFVQQYKQAKEQLGERTEGHEHVLP